MYWQHVKVHSRTALAQTYVYFRVSRQTAHKSRKSNPSQITQVFKRLKGMYWRCLQVRSSATRTKNKIKSMISGHGGYDSKARLAQPLIGHLEFPRERILFQIKQPLAEVVRLVKLQFCRLAIGRCGNIRSLDFSLRARLLPRRAIELL